MPKSSKSNSKVVLVKSGNRVPYTGMHDGQCDVPIVEVQDIGQHYLLGVGAVAGTALGQVRLTRDQARRLYEWAGIEYRKDDIEILKARDWLSVIREAEFHGVRLIAFLAGRGLLEKDRDPVVSLGELLGDVLEEPVIDLEVGEDSGGEHESQ